MSITNEAEVEARKCAWPSWYGGVIFLQQFSVSVYGETSNSTLDPRVGVAGGCLKRRIK